MKRFVKIGQDVVNLDSIGRVSFVEAQSGISDRILIDVGGTTVVIDSAIVGKATLAIVRTRLMEALEPQAWDTEAA